MSLTSTISGLTHLVAKPISGLGTYVLFMQSALRRCVFPPVQLRLLMRQFEFIGNRSIVIIMISSAMVGAIFGLILGDIFRNFGAESMLGAAAGVALSKELAPVFCGFLVTARAGSSMAAEIATMRVNEQIDAMRVMAVNPLGYLVAPRLLGAVVMLPLLTGIFMLVGVSAAYLVGVVFFDIDIGTFIEKLRWIVKPRFLLQGMEKAAVFGLILASIGCFKGFYAAGGAKGVGRATTEAVVISLVSILISDYFMSYLQFDKVF